MSDLAATGHVNDGSHAVNPRGPRSIVEHREISHTEIPCQQGEKCEKLGLIEPGSDDTILSKYERDEWGSDKTSRREHIATRYRILLLIGDDLNDFVAVGDKPTSEARRKLAADHRAMWGQRWILLPNADYGGWERSLFDWDDAAPSAEKLRRKHQHLDVAAGDEASADASQPALDQQPE